MAQGEPCRRKGAADERMAMRKDCFCGRVQWSRPRAHASPAAMASNSCPAGRELELTRNRIQSLDVSIFQGLSSLE